MKRDLANLIKAGRVDPVHVTCSVTGRVFRTGYRRKSKNSRKIGEFYRHEIPVLVSDPRISKAKEMMNHRNFWQRLYDYWTLRIPMYPKGNKK